MSIFNRNNPPQSPAETPAAPPAAETGVSRAEFDQKFTEMMGAIRDLAQRPVVVQGPAAYAPPPPPEITDEELTEAIASGQGAGKVRELVQRRLDAARAEVGREVAAVRDHGAMALGDLAERTFFAGLDPEDRAIFQRYKDEVKGLVNGCEPALRGIVQTWEACFANITGQHRKELEREATEAALRRHAEASAPAAPQPGRGGRVQPNDDTDIPSITDYVGGDQRFDGMTEDEFIRKMNRGKTAKERYKDWNDYVSRGKEIERQLRAITSGDDDEAAA